jgi:hypothetical protein
MKVYQVGRHEHATGFWFDSVVAIAESPDDAIKMFKNMPYYEEHHEYLVATELDLSKPGIIDYQLNHIN